MDPIPPRIEHVITIKINPVKVLTIIFLVRVKNLSALDHNVLGLIVLYLHNIAQLRLLKLILQK